MSKYPFAATALLLMNVAIADSVAQLPPPTTQLAASVYECMVDGQRVFSDQRCGADARQRDIAEPNRMNAQDTHILEQHDSTPRRKAADDADDTQRLRDACARIREQRDEIHARMRIGYSAAQGNRYEDRLRKLDERYRKQRCERYR